MNNSSPKPPVPPQSVEAEESVIGAILVHPKKFIEVADLLTAEDFYQPALRSLYEAMVVLDQHAKPIDALTVIDQMKTLETIDRLNALGGTVYLEELTRKLITIENVAFHARIVKGKANARRVVEVTREISAKGYGEYGDSEAFIDESEKAFLTATRQAHRTNYEHAKPILKGVIEDLTALVARGSAITGVATGFHWLDQMLAGLQLGDLVFVAARPSMGKTALAMNMVDHVSVVQKNPSLTISLEMSPKALMGRLVCARARVDSQKVRHGHLTQRDWIHYYKAAEELSQAPIYIDGGSPGLQEIRAKVRRWRADTSIFPHSAAVPLAKGPPQGLVVIDYLQLIAPPEAKGPRNRVLEIGDMTRGLKDLAKEINLPVVCLAQLNREVEKRPDKRPMLSDLRESGAVEQDADVVMFVYRDEFYTKDECKSEDQGVAEVIVGKQRNGPTGTVRLAFLGQYTKFENLAAGRDNDERQ